MIAPLACLRTNVERGLVMPPGVGRGSGVVGVIQERGGSAAASRCRSGSAFDVGLALLKLVRARSRPARHPLTRRLGEPPLQRFHLEEVRPVRA